MKPWPLRRRIAVWSAGVTAAALLTFAATMAVTLYSEQVEVIDDRLTTDANLLAARHEAGAPLDRGTLQALTVAPQRRHRAATTLFGFVVLDREDGSVLDAQPRAFAEAIHDLKPSGRNVSVRVGDVRVRVGRFPMGRQVLVLGASLAPADESVQDLVGAALIAIPAVLLVVAIGSAWLARRAMAPMAEITRATAAINASNLASRLPVPEADDEIAAHVRGLNETFDRLQRSFEQATRFTADAAHELRTPLTILRGQIEDALRTAMLAPPQEALLLGLLEETGKLQKISDNLLLLARFDTGRTALHCSPVDLSTMVDEARDDADMLAARRRLAVTADIQRDVWVAGDATMLRRVLLNLLDNAIKFNRESGTVDLQLEEYDGAAKLRITNSGPGIPPDRRAGLFERFYRADAGRDRDAGGTGLGLSLCREIVTAHHGRIELTESDADRTEFTVRLPLLRRK